MSIHQTTDFKSIDEMRRRLSKVMRGSGSRRTTRLYRQVEDLAHAVLGAGRRGGVAVCGAVTERWLARKVAEVDDKLKLSVLAALALRGPPVGVLPPGLATLYPETQARLAQRLTSGLPYDFKRFSADIALAVGVTASAGALTVVVPPHGPANLMTRGRRAVGAAVRIAIQADPIAAAFWLAQFKARPLLELHVDACSLRDFNEAGFYRCYHRLAAALQGRPDIGGIYGASWLYDPKLPTVSPNLAFIARSLAGADVRFVRLRTDPVQTAFALHRSPTRRRLYEEGVYRPACYGMYWSRAALLAWAAGHREVEIEQAPAKPTRRRARAQPMPAMA